MAMTKPQPSRGDSSRPAPSPPPKAVEAASRTGQAMRSTRRIALAGLGLAVLAAGFAAFRVIVPAGSPCQTSAWNVAPAPGDIPAGWSLVASQYDVDRKLMTLYGPVTDPQTQSQAVVYVTVTCYPQDAADAVTRAANVANAAGLLVNHRTDLGEQGYASSDSSGAAIIQFRHANLVAYVSAASGATADEVNAIAVALNRAMGGTGTASIASEGASASSPASAAASGSASAAPTPAAPELESALPTTVGTTTLTIQSATGSTVLGTDKGSRAMLAALRVQGKAADDLRVAYAYDATGAVDLSILVMSVNGMGLDALRSLILNSWLVATGAGITTDAITLGGHEFTRIDFGDKGTIDYVLAVNDRVIIIETTDATLASTAAAALP